MESVSIPRSHCPAAALSIVGQVRRSSTKIRFYSIHAVYVGFTAEIRFLVTLLSDKAFSCRLELAQKSSLVCNIHPFHIHICMEYIYTRNYFHARAFHACQAVKHNLLKPLPTPSPHDSLKHLATWTDGRSTRFPPCSPEEEGINNPEKGKR